MANQYSSQYPAGVDFPAKYKNFLEEFYKISDTPEAHELYSQQFAEDATLVMASKRAKGRSGGLVLSVKTYNRPPVEYVAC